MALVILKVSDEARAIGERLNPDALTAAIVRGVDMAGLDVVSAIQEKKLTAAGPKYLNVRTGRLRRSARAAQAHIEGGAVLSSIGSKLPYAAVHEFGFQGVQKVGGFVRRQRSRDVRAGGKKRGKLVATGIAHVRPFQRRVNFRERRMFRDGLNENADLYTRKITEQMLATMEGSTAA